MNLEDDRNYWLNCLELILDHLCVLMESITCPQVMEKPKVPWIKKTIKRTQELEK